MAAPFLHCENILASRSVLICLLLAFAIFVPQFTYACESISDKS
jgi:hypothetical protein